MELLIHIYENKTFQDPWAHFEHAHLKKLGNKLMGSVPSFENTRHFRSWVNSLAKKKNNEVTKFCYIWERFLYDVKENLYSKGVLMDSTWGTKPMCAWLSGFYLVVVKPISNELHQIRIKPIRVNANQMQITMTAI